MSLFHRKKYLWLNVLFLVLLNMLLQPMGYSCENDKRILIIEYNGGGPAPKIAKMVIYSSKKVEYEWYDGNKHEGMISKDDYSEIQGIMERQEFKDKAKWIKSQKYQDIYSDYEEIRVTIDSITMVMPLEKVPVEFIPLIRIVDRVFENNFNNIYDVILSNKIEEIKGIE